MELNSFFLIAAMYGLILISSLVLVLISDTIAEFVKERNNGDDGIGLEPNLVFHNPNKTQSRFAHFDKSV